jgi:membrane-bound ClpP family serine protease
MDPVTFIIICFAIGLILLVVELFVPSGGLIGLAAAVAFLLGIISGFVMSPWLGLGMVVMVLILAPFVFSGMMKLWQKTPVGKAVILNSEVTKLEKAKAPMDAIGLTVTSLRPMGEAEFGAQTFEVISELGPMNKGIRVRVVGHREDGVAVVRGE